jgi:hypothetical protein
MVNSYDKRSYIGAYHHEINKYSGIYIGAASGYEDLNIMGKPFNVNGISPIVAPYVKYKNVKLTLMGEVLNLSY